MEVTKNFKSFIFFELILEISLTTPKHTKDGGSTKQSHPGTPLPDSVCVEKNSSTPITSDTTVDKDGTDKNIKTSNKNLDQPILSTHNHLILWFRSTGGVEQRTSTPYISSDKFSQEGSFHY